MRRKVSDRHGSVGAYRTTARLCRPFRVGELAIICDVAHSTAYRWRNGSLRPGPSALKLIRMASADAVDRRPAR